MNKWAKFMFVLLILIVLALSLFLTNKIRKEAKIPASVMNAAPEKELRVYEDFNEYVIVGVHPYNWMERNIEKWPEIFEAYNVEYLDRNHIFNDVNYRDPEQSETAFIAYTNKLGVPSGTYYGLTPTQSKTWGIQQDYYERLDESQKWVNPQGKKIYDMIEEGAVLDINGNPVFSEPERVKMSVNNPYWLEYQKESIAFAAEKGFSAMNYDLFGPPIVDRYGGDYSQWSTKAFHDQLSQDFSQEELKAYFGIDDMQTFSIKDYARQFPPENNRGNSLLKEFYLFSLSSYLNFVEELHTFTQERSVEHNSPLAFFGNLWIFNFEIGAIIMGQYVDIIQIENTIPLPPHKKNIPFYKMAQAMGEYKKPIWSLHAPFASAFVEEVNRDLSRNFESLNKLYVAEAYASDVIPEIDLGGWPGEDIGGVPGTSFNKGIFIEEGSVQEEVVEYTTFVKENKAYFINPESVADVGLVLSVPTLLWRNHGFWKRERVNQELGFHLTSLALIENHIPYDVVMFGHSDFWNDGNLDMQLMKYSHLMLPYVTSMTVKQWELLSTFLAKGGTLIIVGNDETHSEISDEYEEEPFADLKELQERFGNSQVKFLGSEEIAFYQKTDNLLNMESLLSDSLSHALSNDLSIIPSGDFKNVGINVLKKDNKHLLHVINYDYNYESDSFRSKNNIPLRLKGRFSSVRVASPDFNDQVNLDVAYADGYTTFVLPELITWNIVILENE